ncbi:MAG TPA: glycosyltransferase family 39 protein [Acidimicrobiales bacterium]|nr:glycosyltransferase family 39 protein [Acidimicrobiales bacterium]
MAPPSRPVLVVAGLALASAVGAIVLSSLVFPHLSINNDEGIYRLHGETLAEGHLFPPAPEGLADSSRPWLAAVDDGHYVLKYNPAVPALIAFSLKLSGSEGLFLALIAAGATAMTFLLAREILNDEWDAVAAAALVALSPLVVVQSALVLPYLTTFLLLEVFCWGLLRGQRALVVSGLALGAAFVIRPYDAVLFAPSLLLWFVMTHRHRDEDYWSWPRTIAAFVVPAAVMASTFFIYNALATGSPLEPSFSLLESQDTLGFGTRRLYPSDPPHQFGLDEGIEGAVRHVGALNTWLVGGVVVFALATVTVLRRRAGSVGPWLAATAVLLPLGYVFFWGPWNAAVLWGGTRYVGPFYFMPVLIPLAVLGGRGLADLFRARVAVGIVAALAVAAISTPTLVRAVGDNVDFNHQTESLVALVDHGAPQKLILADLPTPFLMHPSPVVGNDWDGSGATIFAIGQPRRDLDVVTAYPRRTPYRLTFADDFTTPGAPFTGRLQHLSLATANQVELTVTARAPRLGSRLGIEVTANGLRRTYSLSETIETDQVYRERLLVTATGATLAGRAPDIESPVPSSAVDVRLVQLAEPGGLPATVGSQSVPWRADGSAVTVLAPFGEFWTAGAPPPPPIEVAL